MSCRRRKRAARRSCALSENRALVVRSRALGVEANAWILDGDGRVLTAFFVGDAVQDAVTAGDLVIITYFDEADMRGPFHGLAAFSETGELVPSPDEFRSVVDCYCACRVGASRIAYLAYSGFVFVVYDITRRTSHTWTIPQSLHGAAAVTVRGDTVFFHAPYRDPSGVYRWLFGADDAERIGEATGRCRGLPDGRLIARAPEGCIIFHLSDEA